MVQKEVIKHITFPDNYKTTSFMGEDMFSCLRKVKASIVDSIDDFILDSIMDEVSKQGISDLYLIDKGFVLDAIKEKIERERKNE